MTKRFSPTVRRRRLGRELRHLRSTARFTAESAGKELDISQSKISKMEAGHVPVKGSDLRAMFDLYRAGDQDRERLLALYAECKEASWWQAYGDAVSPGTYVDFESEAERIRSFDPLLIPGLLQIEDYSRAVIRAGSFDLDEAGMEAVVRLRGERADVLRRGKPPHLWAIVGEAAIRTVVGSRGIMARQLQHVLAMAKRTNVEVQVMRYADGAHAAMEGGFALLYFGDSMDPTISYIEYPTGNLFPEPKETKQLELVFDHLQSRACKTDESMEIIAHVAEEMSREA